MRVAIIDYGVGNLFSLRSSLTHLGLEAVVTADAQTIRKADRLILPGVGAFGDAMDKLSATGLVPVIREQAAQKPPEPKPVQPAARRTTATWWMPSTPR